MEEVLNEEDPIISNETESTEETGLVKETVVEVLKLKINYSSVITKWRKIVNKYNGRSTVDHDYLQNRIKEWQKQKVSLLGKHLCNPSHICMVGCIMP